MYSWDNYLEDVNARLENGDTKLHQVSRNPSKYEGKRLVANALLNAGFDTNIRNDFLMSPLHYAAESGDIVIVILLILHGSIINVIDIYGLSPLDYAIMNGHNIVADYLVRNGAFRRW
jgi:ankyrin repeat protein